MTGMRVREFPLRDLNNLGDAEWVDRGRRPYIEGITAYVPVKDGYPHSATLPRREQYRGRGYFMVGGIAVIHGRRPTMEEVNALMEWRRPEGILWVEACEGITRKPRTEVLAGSVHEVRHRESGITYLLDPSRIMFSMGNRAEKERIRGLVRPGERVADMYAGIGYFTLPAALAGGFVHAMEIRPLAFSYLERNIRENRVENRVTAGLGDCRDLLAGIYDRIIMGHFSATGHLPDAVAHSRPGTVIHVHSAGKAEDDIAALLSSYPFRPSIETHKVKKLGPHTWHYVQDVTLE